MIEVSNNQVMDVLASIDDPEMPINIVDLGIVEGVDIHKQEITVTITPTYTGCPALTMIDEQIVARVGALTGVERVTVRHVFDPPWSAERISEAGRSRLKSHGVTVPAAQRFVAIGLPGGDLVPCPYCESQDTRLDSAFGPTRCRVIYYCNACRNPFEHLKAV